MFILSHKPRDINEFFKIYLRKPILRARICKKTEARRLPKKLFKDPQCLFELERKQNGCKRNGDKIRNRLRKVDTHRFIGNKHRNDINKRQQKHEFSHDRNGYRSLRVAYRNKRHLTRDLDSEYKHTAEINRQNTRCKAQKLLVGREYSRKGSRKQHDRTPKQSRITKTRPQQKEERPLYPRTVFRPEVKAEYRLRALRDTLKREHCKLHNARKNSHCTHGDVASVFLQRGIEAH